MRYLLLSFLVCYGSVVNCNGRIIEDIEKDPLKTEIPIIAVEIVSDNFGSNQLGRSTTGGLTPDAVKLSIENAMLKLYVIQSQLDWTDPLEISDRLGQVIMSLKDLQKQILKCDKKSFSPFDFLLNPFEITYMIESLIDDDEAEKKISDSIVDNKNNNENKVILNNNIDNNTNTNANAVTPTNTATTNVPEVSLTDPFSEAYNFFKRFFFSFNEEKVDDDTDEMEMPETKNQNEADVETSENKQLKLAETDQENELSNLIFLSFKR